MRRAQIPRALWVAGVLVFLQVLGGCGGLLDTGSLTERSDEDGGGLDSTAPEDTSGSGSGRGAETGSSSSSDSGSGSSNGPGSNGDSGTGFFMTPTSNCPTGSPLSCFVNEMCGGNLQTTLTGKVYDPAGKVPLNNVIVWVPNDLSALPVITPGTSSCSACDTQVNGALVVTTTGPDGSFTLKGVPTVADLPLVVQIGKWRRIIHVTSIRDCGTTTLPSSGTGQARLPKNQQEGDMPQMALLTGGEDDLGCFLARMGIDPAEYSSPHSMGGEGRLDIYQGLAVLGSGPGFSGGTPGNCTNTSCPLWQSTQALETYDIVLLACEGSPFDQDLVGGADGGDDGGVSGLLGGNRFNVNTAAKQAMHDWLDIGGKVLATHFHYTWFQNGPPDFQGVANWLGASVGSGTCDNCMIDVSFPRGQYLDNWLKNVGALTGTEITLDNVADSVSSVNPPTSRWIYGGSGGNSGPSDTKYLSFETPIGGIAVPDAGTESTAQYCGKAAFSDLHVGGMPSGAVPASCKLTDLSAQEKALEFLFFDLSSCEQDATIPLGLPPKP
jgi:hypothetical protein